MKRIWKDQNLWGEREELLFESAMIRLLWPKLLRSYLRVFVSLLNVDDMSKGGDDVDVDAAEW